jgi:hypothetical protein
MSINQIAAGVLAVAGIGGVSAFASNNLTIQNDFKAVQTAITNKDLSAFKTAKTQLVNDKSTEEIAEINSTTQDQLNTIADRQAKMTATQTAIANNDYNAFKTNADQRMLKQVPDQASFDKLVTEIKARTDAMNQINIAIQNNDFNTFKTAEASMQNLHGSDNKSGKTRPTPTDAQIQARFDKMVANYKATGQLPSNKSGMEMMGERGGYFGGKREKQGNWNKHFSNTTVNNSSAQ